jgi:hypothetical protein
MRKLAAARDIVIVCPPQDGSRGQLVIDDCPWLAMLDQETIKLTRDRMPEIGVSATGARPMLRPSMTDRRRSRATSVR